MWAAKCKSPELEGVWGKGFPGRRARLETQKDKQRPLEQDEMKKLFALSTDMMFQSNQLQLPEWPFCGSQEPLQAPRASSALRAGAWASWSSC